MEASISMLPNKSTMTKFKVFESQNQVMVVGSDKHEKEYHILRFIKHTDTEALHSGQTLEDIMKEEVKTFSRKEYLDYMHQLKESHRGRSASRTSFKTSSAQYQINFKETTQA